MSDLTRVPPEAGSATSIVDAEETTTIPPAPEPTQRPLADGPRGPSVLDNVTPEKPRNHPIAYAALALATLALLLALAALMRDNDGGYRPVKVGDNACVIGPQGDTDVLFCQTPGAR